MEKITVDELIKLPVEALKGKIIIYPTDTVYGVGCLFNDLEGIEKIYQMKKRDYGKPIAVLCANLKQVKEISDLKEFVLPYTNHWPGALTIILNNKENTGTIAVRIPDSNVSYQILRHFGPMNTTSVNYSGEKEINNLDEMESLFSEYVDYLVTDYEIFSNQPSTIISCVSKDVKIIRNGGIKF